MNLPDLIDQFVIAVDPSNSIFGKVETAPWVDVLESKLPRRLPASYRNLVTRYAFGSFDAAELMFLGNTGHDLEDDLTISIFHDPIMSRVTLANGYIQFARPTTGSYDPICFNTTKPASNREFAIVQLDHEQILINERIKVVEKVSDSFFNFITDVVRHA